MSMHEVELGKIAAMKKYERLANEKRELESKLSDDSIFIKNKKIKNVSEKRVKERNFSLDFIDEDLD